MGRTTAALVGLALPPKAVKATFRDIESLNVAFTDFRAQLPRTRRTVSR
jgi:hypothetical protein